MNSRTERSNDKMSERDYEILEDLAINLRGNNDLEYPPTRYDESIEQTTKDNQLTDEELVAKILGPIRKVVFNMYKDPYMDKTKETEGLAVSPEELLNLISCLLDEEFGN